MAQYFQNSQLLWAPKDPLNTLVEKFRQYVNRRHGLQLKDYHELHHYSVTDVEFWRDLWIYLRIICSHEPMTVRSPGSLPEIPVWFPGATLNYAENMLNEDSSAIACTTCTELGTVRHYTYQELRAMVTDAVSGLKALGVTRGDRVAAIVTNSINAVVVALATASIGAIFSSTSPDMGAQGLLDRYTQIRPKILFAETQIQYAGKQLDLLSKVLEVSKTLTGDGLLYVVLFPSAVNGQELLPPQPSLCISYSTFLSGGVSEELAFEQLPFSHPLFILYSSGTSGPPKCIVHSAGGVLIQSKKDMMLSFGLTAHDTYLQYTTTGWMMWTSMLGGLSVGARLILYDGSPFYPDPQAFLKLIRDQGVTILGTSPRFLGQLQRMGIKPLDSGSFQDLRTILSIGAVLTSPLFQWTQDAFGRDVQIMSRSGGTDICAAFVTGVPSLPVYAGEIQGKSLGMKVEVFDSNGINIEDQGVPGELVCTAPHPSLPLCLWGDTEYGEKLRETYFNFYPGIWRHGDFMVVNPVTKGIIILGRSDGVLNPSGVRFGSGEIYAVLEQFPCIDDSLCVGQRRSQDTDERVILFLKMRQGQQLTPLLTKKIRLAISTALSPRHVPSLFFQVEDIPYTINGKKVELAVKQIISGVNVKPSNTIANPKILESYYQYRDIDARNNNTSTYAKL